MNGQKAVSIAQVGQVHFDEWVSITSAATPMSAAGSVRDDVLYLTGVNYSYVEQGESASYSLDNFKLKADKHGNALVGKAMLLNGERSATFTRTAPSSPVV